MTYGSPKRLLSPWARVVLAQEGGRDFARGIFRKELPFFLNKKPANSEQIKMIDFFDGNTRIKPIGPIKLLGGVISCGGGGTRFPRPWVRDRVGKMRASSGPRLTRIAYHPPPRLIAIGVPARFLIVHLKGKLLC